MSFAVTNGVETVMPPPAGWVVNFENPTRNVVPARAAAWITGFELVLATLFLGQRLYTKICLLRKFQIDDYMLVFAYIGAIGAQAILLHGYRIGLIGVHAWEITVDDYNLSALLILATTLTYIPTTILSKLTLCVFFYRLSPVPSYRYAVYTTAFVCAGGLGAMWFSILFACKPIAASWDVRLKADATCINSPAVYIIQAALGVITDAMLIMLPVPTVIGLHMSRRQKMGLVGMFAIGSITLVTSVVRLILLLPGLGTPDQPWALADGCLWVNVESNLLIMCGALPTFRIFLNHIAPRILRDRSTRGSSGQPSKTKSYGKSYGLRTFGGGGNTPKRKFDTLVELEHDPHFNNAGLRGDEMGKTDVTVYGGQAEAATYNDKYRGDADSEEAILQTRTTTVSYSPR